MGRDQRTPPYPGLAEASGGYPKHDTYIGMVIDARYVLESLLGEGGMGVVYLGRHKSLDKRVAIKILKPELAEDRDMLERFFNEARAATSIGSQHIVDISDFGMLPEGSAYFVMELLDGRSLGAMMDELKMVPTPRLVKIAKQIAQGLQAAHAAGIVHRDLKPDNVMLVARGAEPDFVKILDFGIAKVANAASKLTRTGSVFGTPHYMSPEQAAGLSVDSRGDIYALGIILYEMACGKVPFDSDNYMGILTQHMYKAPPPPRTLVVPNTVSPGLEAIILKSLTKKPEGRYQTMDSLVADLDALSSGVTPLAVGELMARSGNYNVPADYFHERPVAPNHTLAPLSAGAGAGRKVGILLGIAAGIVLGAMLVVIYAFRVPTSKGATSPGGAPSTSALATHEPSAAPSVAPPGVLRVVNIVVTPHDAQVILPDGAQARVDKGVARIELTTRDPITLTVSRAGYASARVAIGPTTDFERVELTTNKVLAGGKHPTMPVGPTPVPPAPVTVAPIPATPSAPPPPHVPKRPAHCAGIPRDDDSLKAYPECFR